MFESNSQLNFLKLQLREEQLDISKRPVQTGEVAMHKEILTEEKNIVVPVTREELVIEKKVIDNEAPKKVNEYTEIIRVPISEEHIEVIKHPVAQNEVTINSHQLQEIEHVEEILKKEKIHIQSTGDTKITQ